MVMHERPGVYSAYDASSVLSGAQGARVIGVAARASSGTANQPTVLYSLAEGREAFGADESESPGMETLLRLLFAAGTASVVAVAVSGTDYTAAFAALSAREDVKIVVCDSDDKSVQQALRTSVETASAARHERIAVVGGNGLSVTQLVERAAVLNSERVVLVGPDVVTQEGAELSGVFAAAAVAAAIAVEEDPSIPIQGAVLAGLGDVSVRYSDNEIDTLVRGGVTPLEAVGGEVSPVRGVTTRTTTGGVADATWRELTTIMIVDDVIPTLRSSLRSRFSRSKNTTQSRGAIRSQVVLELENKRAQERIDSYGEVSVRAMDGEPTVCLVEFSFAVTHGLSRIYLTAHITV